MDFTVPPGATRIYLIRHGEPEARAKGRCYGRLDVGLSPRGREQMQETARWLEKVPLNGVHASPRVRAKESALPIIATRKVAVEIHEQFSELNFGEFDGMTYEEAEEKYPTIYKQWMENPTQVTFPGGESYAMLRARVLSFLREVVDVHHDRAGAIVSHGGVNRVILADALNLRDEDAFRFDISYASVSVIDYYPNTAVVRLLNGGPS
jgi:alpha-ribazole phosphatase/probable phosphoglycerate mutase